MPQHATPSVVPGQTTVRPSICRWEVSPAPPAPLIAWTVACWRRGIVNAVQSLERQIVEMVDESLWSVDPFELIAINRAKCGSRLSGLVLVHALIAASHVAALTNRARRQVEFLATACPNVRSGAGWLRRLDLSPSIPIGVCAAATELCEVLQIAVDESEIAA